MAASQIFTVPSLPPEARRLPSALQLAASIATALIVQFEQHLPLGRVPDSDRAVRAHRMTFAIRTPGLITCNAVQCTDLPTIVEIPNPQRFIHTG